jgi:hypothetical protein
MKERRNEMEEKINHRIRQTNVWLWLTLPIAILLAVAAGGGLFITGLYRDASNLAAQAVGQDLISLAIVLPILITTAILAHRGSVRARLVWLGTLVYLVYCYALLAFDIKFNLLFLVYVALLGCSLYALIGGLVTADMAGIKASFAGKAPVKTVSVYLAVLGALFYFLWLSELVPALVAGQIPQSVLDDGAPTNGVHVLDMAWILPAFGITAASLWRKQALGYTLAGVMLSYFVLLVLAILSMVVFMVWDGHPVAVPQVAIFGTLLAISLGMLIWYIASTPKREPLLRADGAGAL